MIGWPRGHSARSSTEKRADHLLEIDKLYQEDTGWKLRPSMPTA